MKYSFLLAAGMEGMKSIDLRFVEKYRIACCIPVQNPGPEFAETLKSFCVQNVKPYLIVVDDGSTEPVSLDLESLGLDGQVIRLERGFGISAALNLAFMIAYTAKFDFIARMDGDDINMPERFAIQTQYMDDHKDVLGCFSWAEVIDHNGNVIGNLRAPVARDQLKRAMAFNNVLLHPTAFLRRSYITRYGLFPEKSTYAEDYVYFLRGVKDECIGVIPSSLIRYRVHDRGISFSRYRSQIISRMKTQFLYLMQIGPLAILGIMRSLALLAMVIILPGDILNSLRRRKIIGKSRNT